MGWNDIGLGISGFDDETHKQWILLINKGPDELPAALRPSNSTERPKSVFR